MPGAPCGWIGCSWNQCPTAPAPISTGKDPPRLNQQKRKSQSERPAPSALAFLLPAARPDQHREGLPPPRSAQGRTAPPTVTTCPICPAWAVTACPMSSGPPARSPARAAPSSRTPPPTSCTACTPCQTSQQPAAHRQHLPTPHPASPAAHLPQQITPPTAKNHPPQPAAGGVRFFT